MEGIVILFAARRARNDDSRPRASGLRLEGLEPASAGALINRHAAAALSADVRERLVIETAGNPLALLELSSA